MRHVRGYYNLVRRKARIGHKMLNLLKRLRELSEAQRDAGAGKEIVAEHFQGKR